jgi:mono/diheme cytochrome c family protein
MRVPLLAAGVAIGLGFVTEARAQTTPEARGQALVADHCGRCHAVGAVGDSPNPQAPPFRRLHERFPVENLAEALVEGLRVGHTQMPQFQFSEQDAGDIIAYLKSIQSDAQAPVGQAAPASAAATPAAAPK